MKRFASIFPFLEHGSAQLHIGRLVANHDFVKALLRYGTCDEYVFSGPSIENLRTFEQTVRRWALPPERLAAIRCMPYAGFSQVLAREAIHVAHVGGWGYFMPGLHYLRQRACAPFPITGVTFSLHGREVVDHAVRVSHAGMTDADAIFCISRDGREVMRRLLDGAAAITNRAWQGQLLCLPLGIDDDLFDVRGDRVRCRQRLRIPDEAVVLLTLGRITPAQKMDLGPWLRTVARGIMPAAHVPIVVVLAGGASPADLRMVKEHVDAEGIADIVRVHANFPADQKADLLAAADVLVMPTDNTQETFGLSLIEAQAAGVPIVASHYDGYKDIVRDGIDGFLIETLGLEVDPLADWFDVMDGNVAQIFQSQAVAIDLDALRDAVVRLVNDAGLRRTMGEAGRVRAAAEFRFSRIIARYEEAWDALAARAAARPPSLPVASPWNLDPVTVFGHYPTRRLETCTEVVATGSPADLLPFSDVTTLVTPRLLATLLSLAETPASVGLLRAEAAHDVPPTLDAARVVDAAVLWLLKYGLLRQVRADGAGNAAAS